MVTHNCTYRRHLPARIGCGRSSLARSDTAITVMGSLWNFKGVVCPYIKNIAKVLDINTFNRRKVEKQIT